MSEEPNIVLNVASQLSYLLCCSIPSIMSEEPNIVLNVASQLSYLLCCSISSIMSEEPNIVLNVLVSCRIYCVVLFPV